MGIEAALRASAMNVEQYDDDFSPEYFLFFKI